MAEDPVAVEAELARLRAENRWFTNAEEQGGKLLEVAVALLQALNDLPAKPDEEVPHLQASPAGPPP